MDVVSISWGPGFSMTSRQVLQEWLILTNKRYKEEGIEHGARPWKALSEYSAEFHHSIAMGRSGPGEFIFDWFKQRSKKGSHEIGSLYESAFCYDGTFWELRIPIGFGSFCLSLPACLGETPEVIKYELSREVGVNTVFSRKLLEHWSNCIDYAYGVRDLIDGEVFTDLALVRLKSADQEMRAANHLLLNDSSNSTCARSYRFVVEKLLKAVGWHAGVFVSRKSEKVFSHGLKGLAEECAQKTGARFFAGVPEVASLFPSLDSRYEESRKDSGSLWQVVFLAQSIAACIVRLYSGRDSRSQICPWVMGQALQFPTPPAP